MSHKLPHIHFTVMCGGEPGDNTIGSACGLRGFCRSLDSDPPNTGGADIEGGKRALFCHAGHEDLVTCDACKPEAMATKARRERYDKFLAENAGKIRECVDRPDVRARLAEIE